ncbi:MAG TPA: histidine kinase [Cyclobacteriaceae bacterium]|nr:histidine kinase [Cyclobacteriaceae bacterium]
MKGKFYLDDLMPSARIQSNSLLKKRWFQHVFFWTCIYFFDVFVFGWDTQNYRLFFKMVTFEMPGQMLLAYVMMYGCIPLFFNKKYIAVVVLFVATFILCSFSAHALMFYFSNYYQNTSPGTTLFSSSKLLVRGFYLFANAAIAVIIKLTKMWYLNELRLGETQHIRLESELKMLKDQINPHFMFNTLNNLYGLVERNPRHAQEMILGLSRILHYMLHESNHPIVPLRKEMDCIRDYIELEKIRYPGNLSVSMNQEKGTECLGIVPLVIFPFVENSFKHGASETIDMAWINIDCSVYKNDFVFKIENTKNMLPHDLPNPGGIGLNNVRRRLELIYGDDHTLQIIDGHDTYLVVLKIKLGRMTSAEEEKHEAELSYSGR